MDTLPTYIKVDDNTVIHTSKIQWVKEHKECMYVCTQSNRCSVFSLHEICKKKNIVSYLMLERLFV